VRDLQQSGLLQPLISVLAALGRWRGKERFLVDSYPDYARYLKTLTGGRKAPQ
jgi:hypothetical protein